LARGGGFHVGYEYFFPACSFHDKVPSLVSVDV
jgi:hypothetical protein